MKKMCVVIFLLINFRNVFGQMYAGALTSVNLRQRIIVNYGGQVDKSFGGLNSTLGINLGYRKKRIDLGLTIFRATSNTIVESYWGSWEYYKKYNKLTYTDYSKNYYYALNPNIGIYLWKRNPKFKLRLNLGANVILSQRPNNKYYNQYNCKRIIDSTQEVQFVHFKHIQNTAFTSNLALEYHIHKYSLILNAGANYKFDFRSHDLGRLVNVGRQAVYNLWEVNVWVFNVGVGVNRSLDWGRKAKK